ncbi:hypothetical protein GCM10010250_56400 [Streptomyces althioticus]|nr:hypothetical protein GCM10010250_56400 [Streptomyces althioticus]
MISKRKGFSLRLVILLKENYWVKAHGPDGPMCRTWFNGLCGANIPYAKENFRATKYWRVRFFERDRPGPVVFVA